MILDLNSLHALETMHKVAHSTNQEDTNGCSLACGMAHDVEWRMTSQAEVVQ